MNAKMKKRRVWAAVLSIAAVLAMTAGGLGGVAIRSVYAGDDINTNGVNKVQVGSSITYKLDEWNEQSKSGWSKIDRSKNMYLFWTPTDSKYVDIHV